MSSFRCGLQVSRNQTITNEHTGAVIRDNELVCSLGGDVAGRKESTVSTDVIGREMENELDLEKINKQQLGLIQEDQEQEGDGLLEYIYDLPVRKIVQKLPIRKMIEKVGATASNLFPSSDEKARDIYPGEYHSIVKLPNGKYGRANYTGPGTQVIKRLRRNGGDPPRVLSDKVSQAHDIRYALAQNTKDVRAADKRMVRDLKQLSRESTDSSVNIQPPMRTIQAKMLAEDFSLLSREKFVDLDKKPIGTDKKILDKKLKELEQQGYGRQNLARQGSDISGIPQVDRRRYRSLLERVKNEQYNVKGANRNRNFRTTSYGSQLGAGSMRGSPYMRQDRNINQAYNWSRQHGSGQVSTGQPSSSSEKINISTSKQGVHKITDSNYPGRKSGEPLSSISRKQMGRGYPGANIIQVGSGYGKGVSLPGGSGVSLPGSGVSLPGSGKMIYPADKLLKKMSKRIKKNKGTKRIPLYVDEREMSGFLADKLLPMISVR